MLSASIEKQHDNNKRKKRDTLQIRAWHARTIQQPEVFFFGSSHANFRSGIIFYFGGYVVVPQAPLNRPYSLRDCRINKTQSPCDLWHEGRFLSNIIPLRKLASELRRYREKNVRLLYRSCVSCAYIQRISFLSFVVVVLFFVEVDNMHDDFSTYFGSFIGEENRYL